MKRGGSYNHACCGVVIIVGPGSKQKGIDMSISIVGSGAIGSALAGHFAAKGVRVTIANQRGPASLAPIAEKYAPHVAPVELKEALTADTIILALPFSAIAGLASMTNWSGRTIVDATNAINFTDFTAADLGGKSSSSLVQETLSGSQVVKAFNTIPAAILTQTPEEGGGRRVVFLSGDNPDVRKDVAALIDDLGFAPMDLGSLQDGAPQQCFHPLWAKNLILKG
jgi:8-hydroxy-5-deazaflavin:NADPH oxidoreductase